MSKSSSSKKSERSIRFSKRIVLFCVIFISIYTIAQSVINYFTGTESSPTLTTCVYAFFGTELASVALIRIFKKEDQTNASERNSRKDDMT